jgi:hypothetical protein
LSNSSRTAFRASRFEWISEINAILMGHQASNSDCELRTRDFGMRNADLSFGLPPFGQVPGFGFKHCIEMGVPSLLNHTNPSPITYHLLPITHHPSPITYYHFRLNPYPFSRFSRLAFSIPHLISHISHSTIRIPNSAIRNPISLIPQSAFRIPQSEIPHLSFRNPHSEFRNPKSHISDHASAAR